MRGEARLSHGSGGKEPQELLEYFILTFLDEEAKNVEDGFGTDELDDGSAIPLPSGGYAVITVYSYTVKPVCFPSNNIGELAASGTMNDLLMMEAKP